MFSKDQKEAALRLYDELGRIGSVVDRLGYPSRTCPSNWVTARGRPRAQRKAAVRLAAQEKAAAVELVLAGEPYREVADAAGVAPRAVLARRRAYLEKGAAALMTGIDRKGSARQGRRPPGRPRGAQEAHSRAAVRERPDERGGRARKKDPGVDPRSLSNREKAALIDAMRETYSLSFLASRLRIAESSCHYARRAAAAPDRWAEARRAVVEELEAAGRARGHRCVHRRPAERGVACGGRTVRRLTAEEGCGVVCLKRPRAWSSYAGEVSEASPNPVARRLRADAPNRPWLTDITGFRLPRPGEPKVHLSPVVDCFDGMVAAWSIGTSPNAELANSSLERACARLSEGEAPVIHSDRGGRYRWPGRIAICE